MTLDEILEEWYRSTKLHELVMPLGTQPMFKQSKTPRGWDTTDEIMSRETDKDRIKTVDFEIQQLCFVYRVALGLNARNLYTGKNVWNSIALPENQEERAKILQDARNALASKLREICIL